MTANKANLEDKLLYRLVKVIYIITFLLVSLMVIAEGWWFKPVLIVDSDKSTITCSNGKSYSFNTVGISASLSEAKQLDSYNDRKAREFCKEFETYIIENKQTGEQQGIKYSDFPKYNLINPDLDRVSYSFNLVESTTGSWTNVILRWTLGIAISYVILNLIRETLNYILFGKPFDWLWLLIPIATRASSTKNKHNDK